jgi:hypothetical protein
MSAVSQFDQWRNSKRANQSWGLAWALANEFCRRFYASHGIVPWVIEHEGLGYYGIQLDMLPCAVNGNNQEALGRLTQSGNAENWRTGGPGDHGCKLIDRCDDGAPFEELIQQAISHLDLPSIPYKSHLNCRHKRWGSSYELCFEIVTLAALQHDPDEITIWNHPEHTRAAIAEDPKQQMKEHPGAFLLKSGANEICLAGDGRLLSRSNLNLWHEYMKGSSVAALCEMILQELKI